MKKPRIPEYKQAQKWTPEQHRHPITAVGKDNMNDPLTQGCAWPVVLTYGLC
jgi:hypothetical protein